MSELRRAPSPDTSTERLNEILEWMDEGGIIEPPHTEHIDIQLFLKELLARRQGRHVERANQP